ncbi:MAG: AhpC/TSA family protein [Bacteroidales bacterium]|nr:AhpC/TSA family protein [Bacteroidales bacterium]
MKKLSFLLLSLLVCISCDNSTAKYSVKVSGLEDGASVYLVDQITSEPIKSGSVENGAFSFKGQAEKDAYLAVVSDGSDWMFPFFNDGKPIEVNFEQKNLSGSSLNNRLNECHLKNNEAYEQYEMFVSVLETLPEEELIARLEDYQDVLQKYSDVYLEIIEDNKDNIIPVAFLLQVPPPAKDRVDELLASDAPAASHPFAKELQRQKELYEILARTQNESKQGFVGQKFTDLEENDPMGVSRKLSDYVGRGKWVLVDFWASWCGPCKAELPYLVSAYKEYHGKGFDIVGLSLDKELDPWLDAIEEWEMPWIHLSDLKEWESIVVETYSVYSIPDNLLIDPEGTIVARGLRGNALEDKLAEIFN